MGRARAEGNETGVRIEDYAVVGDTETAALVSRDGSLDWLCVPRFDSPACFARLLGDERHGYWRLAPAGEVTAVRRRYRPGTLVLETEMDTAEGTVRLVDLMPVRDGHVDVLRIVEGVRGRVRMRMELVIRFDYGSVVPWVRTVDNVLVAVAGPDAVYLHTPVETRGEDLRTVADFSVGAGDSVPFTLIWAESHLPAPRPGSPGDLLDRTEQFWLEWTGRSTYDGDWPQAVQRSLITLKALTYAPTGGIVAAPTTSLPEDIGGVRNWDYRYCWLRDATLTLQALMVAGYLDEARAWREWLLRAVAGSANQIQIMYGPAGERRLPETDLPWLPGYENSRPVRIGNGAVNQVQVDVFGELMDALHQARREKIDASAPAWALQCQLMRRLVEIWDEPDEGIWEVRGGRRHFTHSKVMAWVALDRAVKDAELFRLNGPVDEWRKLRDHVHDEVCRNGFDPSRGTFTQYYGGTGVDASLLMIPLVGFLPPNDERVVGTVRAIEQELCVGGLVHRYRPDDNVDGIEGGEGAFLACSFWLASCYGVMDRRDDARTLFEHLLSLRNDVGLLAEEYDVARGRLVGNFPQAFSHIALVNAAYDLSEEVAPHAVRTDEVPPR